MLQSCMVNFVIFILRRYVANKWSDRTSIAKLFILTYRLKLYTKMGLTHYTTTYHATTPISPHQQELYEGLAIVEGSD